MVEYSLNAIFHSLADETRRDVLKRTLERDQTISELADKYQMSFAAVAKHVGVLEKAGLVTKKKQGRRQFVSVKKEGIEIAKEHLQRYERMWSQRFDALEYILNKEKTN